MLPEQKHSKAINKWDAAGHLRKRIPQANYNRRAFDRIFYRNDLFYVGQQWLRYSRQIQQWQPISVPDWFPKQITNKFAVYVDAMKSVLDQSDPKIIYQPSTSSERDIAGAQVAESVSDVIDNEVRQSELANELALWVALNGNGFIIDDYDNDAKHGTQFIPSYVCLRCALIVRPKIASQGCPNCGPMAPLTEAKGPDGQPIGESIPVGSMHSEVASPFEMHFDMQCLSISQAPYIYRARTYPIDLLKQMFPEYKDKIKPDDAGIDSGMFYQSALSYITNATATTPGNFGGSVGSIDNVPRATLYREWVRPCPDLPEGGEAYIIGDTTVWKGELTKHDDKGNPFVPITHFGFQPVAGRVFYRTPADDLVFKQIQRNKIEALIQIGLERMSNPAWLIPKGIGIDAVSGEPGEKIWYNPFIGAGMIKPERVAGTELTASILKWVESIDRDMADIAGMYDIMKGQAPDGVPTLGGLQMLTERGMARFAAPLNNWARGWMQVRQHRLWIWKEYAHDDRTVAVAGRNSKWEVQQFNSASISGSYTIRIEEGNIAPKSKAYQQMVTAQLLEAGLVDVSDPTVRHRILSDFDASHLVEGLDIDIKDAIKEEDEFTTSGALRPRAGIDNDAIHLQQHVKRAKTDEFFGWPPEQQQIFTQHIQYHQQQIAAAQQAQMQNDPHILNAKAHLAETQVELQAFKQQKGIELDHLQKKEALKLHGLGIKEGIKTAAALHRPPQKTPQNGVKTP